MVLNYIITFLVAFGISVMLTPLVKVISLHMGWLDKPSWRKLNKRPMPLLGGIAIYIGFTVALIFIFYKSGLLLDGYKYKGFFIGALVLILTGIQDDIKGLTPRRKLFYQIAAAMIAYGFGFSILNVSHPLGGFFQAPAILSMLLTVFWIVGLINAINLLDGMDGLAAGVVSIIGISLFFSGIRSDNPTVAILAIGLAGSTLGFLPYNFNPAKIFMGDTGSMFLGFTLAIISIEGAYKGQTFVTLLVPVIAMAVPVIDTGLSIVRRIMQKKKISQADKGHIHHQLLIQEGSQKKAVLTLYFLTISFGFIAVGLSRMQGIWAFFGILLTVLLTIRWAISFDLLDFIRKNGHTTEGFKDEKK